jgi:hypothetical protein
MSEEIPEAGEWWTTSHKTYCKSAFIVGKVEDKTVYDGEGYYVLHGYFSNDENGRNIKFNISKDVVVLWRNDLVKRLDGMPKYDDVRIILWECRIDVGITIDSSYVAGDNNDKLVFRTRLPEGITPSVYFTNNQWKNLGVMDGRQDEY